jgi:outer membrane protein assembly factor BamB
MRPVLCFAAALFVATLVLQMRAENWPGFRGPTGQGLSTETGLPLKWSATENVRWKVPVPGEGWSSPVVWGDHVFVTAATDGGRSCRVLAFDRATGRVLWDREVFTQETKRKERRNTYATPTPCTDGKRVYAVFGGGGVAAVDFEGRVAWTNLDFPYYSRHGLGSSPVLFDGKLIMARDASQEATGDEEKVGWQKPWDKSFVLALDTETGEVAWKTGRGVSRIGHVSPIVWKDEDGRGVVISGAGDVVQGFDAQSGELLWTQRNEGEGVTPSYAIAGDLVVTAAGWGGRESTKAFKLDGEGDLGETAIAWEEKKGMPHLSSFVSVGDRVFWVSDDGVAWCVEAATGAIVWRERLGGNYSASPLVAEGRIYFTSDEGKTTVIEAGRAFKVLGENELGERVQASPAASQGDLFIRTERQLFCIGE